MQENEKTRVGENVHLNVLSVPTIDGWVMQKEEKDSPITDNKKLRTQRVIDRFDGAALLTLRRLTSEELKVLVDYVNQYRLGAWGGVPAPRPQSLKKEQQ